MRVELSKDRGGIGFSHVHPRCEVNDFQQGLCVSEVRVWVIGHDMRDDLPSWSKTVSKLFQFTIGSAARDTMHHAVC